MEFSGTVLLVSHDRAFVDSVASSCLLFEGNGQVSEHIGGYREVAAYQARQAKQQLDTEKSAVSEQSSTGPRADAPVKTAPRKKLSYKDQRELDALPERIETLEAELESLAELSASAEFYQQDADSIADTMAKMTALQEELDSSMERWLALSE